ncbi:MAG: hypothetical protein Q4G40_07615, partial [Brachybacterium sp.]|nr:hypothetical protein [Brachybacterium sp.]
MDETAPTTATPGPVLAQLPGLDDVFAATERTLGDQLRELRSTLRLLPMLGPFNASLVHTQLPGARYVARRSEWWERFGRTLAPGARPLVILRPYGPVDFVYDIAHTDGPPLPHAVRDAYRLRGPVTVAGYDSF